MAWWHLLLIFYLKILIDFVKKEKKSKLSKMKAQVWPGQLVDLRVGQLLLLLAATELHAASIILPSSPAYAECRADENSAVDRFPAAIWMCASEDDVVAALSYAAAHSQPVSIRSGGHSYTGNSLGSATCLANASAVAIDVAGLDAVRIAPNASNATVTVGPGVNLRALAHVLAEHSLALPLGTCTTVGIAGFTLGGGHGLLMRRFGVAADSLISARVALANGTVVVASASMNTELLWALRGGGNGHFGVVTSLTFAAHRVESVALLAVRWPGAQLHAVLTALQTWGASNTSARELGLTLHATAASGSFAEDGVRLLGLWVPKSQGTHSSSSSSTPAAALQAELEREPLRGIMALPSCDVRLLSDSDWGRDAIDFLSDCNTTEVEIPPWAAHRRDLECFTGTAPMWTAHSAMLTTLTSGKRLSPSFKSGPLSAEAVALIADALPKANLLTNTVNFDVGGGAVWDATNAAARYVGASMTLCGDDDEGPLSAATLRHARELTGSSFSSPPPSPLLFVSAHTRLPREV